MNTNSFWSGLGLCTVLSAVLLGILVWFVPVMRPYGMFSAMSVLFFAVLAAILHFSGEKAIQNKNKMAFNSLVLSSVFAKLVLTLVILFAYKKATAPTDGWYAVLFLLAYVIFTTFEVIFLTRQARK